MIEKKLAKTVRVLCASGMLATGLTSAVAYAEEVQKVEILGSSIKRIAKEGALPVQTLSNAEIQKSGAKTVEDLIQNLPAMQGFTASSSSVNGSGGGVQTASVHGIGESYTLVLLNGRRMAPYGSGSAVNLASIPMSAVERVEVLTDGASALYGSDAIAGVVNFVLKKNQTDAVIEATYNGTTQSGGQSYNASISKGFGNLEENGYNVLLSYSHDELKELNASQREFGKSGLVKFMHDGQQYSLYQLSGNSSPATVNLGLKGGRSFRFSPDYAKSGACGENTFLVKNSSSEYCGFDYASTVMLQPKSKRDSFFGSLNYKINEETTFFAEAVASRYVMNARHAPVAQPIPVNAALFTKYVQPYLAQYKIDPSEVTSATAGVRLFDAGGRAYDYTTDAKHLALGITGAYKGFDYTISYVHSENKFESTFAGGFLSADKFFEIVDAGKFDPFLPAGGSKSVLAPAVLSGIEQATKVKLDTISARVSGELMKVPGGMAQFGTGVDFSKQTYISSPSAIAQGANPQQPNFTDAAMGSGVSGTLPADASRKNWGAFAEVLMPVMKNLDLTASGRYDSYTAVTNSMLFDQNSKRLNGSVTEGNPASKFTYKIAASYRPVDSLMLRGSYATGFKVASLTQISQPMVHSGVTDDKYDCPVTAPDPRAAYCKGNAEYDLLSGGNSTTGDRALKPEKSTQYTMGFRLEPTNSLSLGMDLWMVRIKDQIFTLSDTEVFGKPAKYSYLFKVIKDPIQGNVLARESTPFNMAEGYNKGIDWDHSFRTKTGFGDISVQWTGTYMLNSDFINPGSDWESSIGRFDTNNNVVSRLITRIATTWKQSNHFSHTLAMNYKSGYHDMELTAGAFAIRKVNADGSLGDYVGMKRDVDSFTTFDWQTRYDYSKALSLTAGVKNLFNTDPPFSVRTKGGGNQSGFDARYASALGRQIYVTGNYRF